MTEEDAASVERVSRRYAIGLLGGFAALAIGAAPFMHDRAVLDLDVDVVAAYDAVVAQSTVSGEIDLGELEPDAGEVDEDFGDPGDIAALDVDVANNDGESVDPLFFTWDQRRKTRHNWEVDHGPSTLEAGERARYRIVSPSEEGRIHAGFPTQLTVFDHGRQRWKSVHVRVAAETEVPR